MRLAIGYGSAMLVCSLSAPVLAYNTIDIQTESFDNFIVLTVTVDDNVGSGNCTFTLRRTGLTDCATADVATFPRVPGTTKVYTFYDAPLQASRAYRYEVLGCADGGFQATCGGSVNVSAATTPAPALLGHGHVTGNFGVWSCLGSCANSSWYALPQDAYQYLDTGTDLLLYGSIVYAGCQNGWSYYVDQAVPAECTVAVAPSTWTRTKNLYR